jgi:hypothetical protein
VTKLPAITRPLELAAAAMQKSVGEEGGAVPCETLGEKREGAVVGSQLCGRPTYSPGLARPAGRNCQRPPASLLIIRRYVWERFFFFFASMKKWRRQYFLERKDRQQQTPEQQRDSPECVGAGANARGRQWILDFFAIRWLVVPNLSLME